MSEKQRKDVELEEVDFDVVEELEEVVTPGFGTVACCTA